jgi:cytochrome c553
MCGNNRKSLVRWKVKKIMKITTVRNVGSAIGAGILVAFASVVSGAFQTELKFTDPATYYKDAKCVVCHGQKAEKKFNTELKDEELIEIVMKGKKPEKPPNMPSYEAKGLTAEQAKALVEHMKQLKSAP